MRHLFTFLLMITLAGSTAAADLGNVSMDVKSNSHIGMNPGTPDGREGGENVGSAIAIAGLPFSDTGNTSDNVDDYDAVCTFDGSTSPDVVYSYTPTGSITVSVDLCGSSYDTKTYILDAGMNIVACNDDFYYSDDCGWFVSYIEEFYMADGQTYYIVVDGFGGDSGDYVLSVRAYEPTPPCTIECGDDEGEPELVNGYLDAFNGGCNSPDFGNPFSVLEGDGVGELVHCGIGGWYITAEGENFRDTDWYTAIVGVNGVIEWTIEVEIESYVALLGPNDCDSVGVVADMVAFPCYPTTMTIHGDPGEIVWLFVGAGSWVAPDGFIGHEYSYLSTFTGLMETPTATETITFDGIKSLYR